MKRLATLFASLALLIPSISSAQSTIDAQFGWFFGSNHINNPTRILDGSGALGEAMVGESFLWVCLDRQAIGLDTDNATLTLNVSTTPEVLASGIWGTELTSTAARQSITDAIKNIFFNNQEAIYNDVSANGYSDTPGTAFQLATWYIIESHIAGIWSETLDSTAIDNILLWNGGTTSMLKASLNPLLASYIESSLDGSLAAGKEIYFASQGPDSPYQTAILLPATVPEPGSLLLVGIAGGAALLFRRKLN